MKKNIFDVISRDDLLIFPESVVVLGLHKSGEVLLVEQFRKSINKSTLELPGGKIKELESPHQAACRELYEETGFVCHDLTHFFSLDLDFSVSSHTTHLFHGNVSMKDNSHDHFDYHLKPIEEVVSLIKKGMITHAPTVTAIMLYSCFNINNR